MSDRLSNSRFDQNRFMRRFGLTTPIALAPMAAASGGLVFINGLGAVAGPLIVGALMENVGPGGFYLFTGVLFAMLVGYAAYRMTQRSTIAVEDTGAYVPMAQAAMTPVAMEIAQEYAIEVELEAESPQDAA